MSNDFDELFQQPRGWAQRLGDPRPAPPDEEPERPLVEGAYRAYGFAPKDDMETCDIAWWLPGGAAQGQEIQYRFLIRIGYLGDEHLSLMLTDCIIDLEGRNLRDLRKRLARKRVTYIQAFHPLFWSRPPENEPIIEKVQLLYPGEASSPKDRP